MTRLLPAARSFLIHSGQAVTLMVVAVLAMAAAPATREAGEGRSFAVPEAPPTAAVAEPAGPVTRQIAFSTPISGYAINSAYGLRRLPGEAARSHQGVDIAAPHGTGVYVAAEGRVMRAGYDADGYGRFVEVQHANGMNTLYGHLSRLDVATGDTLDPGSRLGLVGSTGRSTGPHLHFEVRRGDRRLNPEQVIGQTFQTVVSS